MIPAIATDPIEMSVTGGVAVTIAHGLGRQVAGWLVIWRSAECEFVIADALDDSSKELVLIPSGTAKVRLVLL